MSDWLPIVTGIVIILVAVGIARLAPDSSWGQELRRSYGVRPTGTRGIRTRRDHLRSAVLSAVLVVALIATSIGASLIAGNPPSDTQRGMIAQTYSFGAFILGAMAIVAMLRSIWKAAVWRIELPDTPAHRRGLADAIDHLLDGSVTPEERAAYLDVRYLHPQLEQVRRATMQLVSQHRSGVPDGFRTQIKEWTAGIRASAGPV